jgi:hypothetical protein
LTTTAMRNQSTSHLIFLLKLHPNHWQSLWLQAWCAIHSTPHCPTLVNKGAHSASGRFRTIGNTYVKRTYYFAHINIVEATKKGSQMLVDSIHRMQETSL